MRKLLLISLLSLFFISCSKHPFVVYEANSGSALVYIYSMSADNTSEIGDNAHNEIKFNVAINGKSSDYLLGNYEYEVYKLPLGEVSFVVMRNSLEKRKLELELESGQTYYLRVQSTGDGFGQYDFREIDQNKALDELEQTTLSGRYESSENKITELFKENKEIDTVSESKSKLNEVKEAFKMKEDGLLSQEEFEKMKAEILAE